MGQNDIKEMVIERIPESAMELALTIKPKLMSNIFGCKRKKGKK